jgi:hypothetical protein
LTVTIASGVISASLSGSAGGDLTGTSANPAIVKIGGVTQGNIISHNAAGLIPPAPRPWELLETIRSRHKLVAALHHFPDGSYGCSFLKKEDIVCRRTDNSSGDRRRQQPLPQGVAAESHR